MIPFSDFGGNGQALHFLHANGYPPACYQELMDMLAGTQHVSAMHLRPLWPAAKPEEIGSWHPLSDDLLQFIQQQNLAPLIAVGHSIGAIVSLRAAMSNPGLFRALILIDPVLFTPSYITGYGLMRRMGLADRTHPLIAGALKRRRHFDNPEALFKAYRRKDIFRYFSDQALRNYITGILRPREAGGYELAYSPEWEARIYHTGIWNDMDLWRKLPRLKLPTLIIRGAETDTFLAGSAMRINRIRPQTSIVTLEKSTHLVPLEKPFETFTTIRDFLKENL
jgi:pimeloyl-ACP methyl ester carboxylesterase